MATKSRKSKKRVKKPLPPEYAPIVFMPLLGGLAGAGIGGVRGYLNAKPGQDPFTAGLKAGVRPGAIGLLTGAGLGTLLTVLKLLKERREQKEWQKLPEESKVTPTADEIIRAFKRKQRRGMALGTLLGAGAGGLLGYTSAKPGESKLERIAYGGLGGMAPGMLLGGLIGGAAEAPSSIAQLKQHMIENTKTASFEKSAAPWSTLLRLLSKYAPKVVGLVSQRGAKLVGRPGFWKSTIRQGLRSARTSGLIGAGIGGVQGFLNPEEGQSRLGSALSGALRTGATWGTLGGVAGGIGGMVGYGLAPRMARSGMLYKRLPGGGLAEKGVAAGFRPEQARRIFARGGNVMLGNSRYVFKPKGLWAWAPAAAEMGAYAVPDLAGAGAVSQPRVPYNPYVLPRLPYTPYLRPRLPYPV